MGHETQRKLRGVIVKDADDLDDIDSTNFIFMKVRNRAETRELTLRRKSTRSHFGNILNRSRQKNKEDETRTVVIMKAALQSNTERLNKSKK